MIKIKVRCKVVPVFFLNWAPRHEGVFGEWRYSSTHSLTSVLDGDKWSSRPGRFTLREIAPGIHWIGSWVGPRAVLDEVVKRKIPSLRRESNPSIPNVQPVYLKVSHDRFLSHPFQFIIHNYLHIQHYITYVAEKASLNQETNMWFETSSEEHPLSGEKGE
jgi:hypothetical protein